MQDKHNPTFYARLLGPDKSSLDRAQFGFDERGQGTVPTEWLVTQRDKHGHIGPAPRYGHWSLRHPSLAGHTAQKMLL